MKTCSHGVASYCHDDASATERGAFEACYRAAFVWGVTVGLGEERAERFASWSAARNFQYEDAWADGLDWNREFDRYRISAKGETR